MKLILSRKGFDSCAGGVPSPIFPNGLMYSLPIEARGASKRYAEIRKGVAADRTDIGSVVEQLTAGRTSRDTLAHLDPDLDPAALTRLPGWRPCFGQTSSSQSHLASSGVGPGDMFLFFGWFRRVARNAHGGWEYAGRSPQLHTIFGWLQVGEVIGVDAVGVTRLASDRPWLADHPHLRFGPDRRNTIYAASDRLVLPGIGDTGLSGAGDIRTFDASLVLTAPGSNRRGLWKLPSWFMADGRCEPLTYHSDRRRWRQTSDSVLLETVGRGQEFVLDCTNRLEAARWVAELLRVTCNKREVA